MRLCSGSVSATGAPTGARSGGPRAPWLSRSGSPASRCRSSAWFTVGFGPTEGGYASVYFGWTGFIVLFGLGAAFWLETTVASSIRYRKTLVGSPEPGEASGDPYRAAHDIEDPLSLVPPSLEAVTFYWIYFAVLVVIAWVILYLL